MTVISKGISLFEIGMRDTLTPFHDENLFAPKRTCLQTNKAEPMLLASNRLVKNWAQARDIFDVLPMSTQNKHMAVEIHRSQGNSHEKN